MTWFVYCTQNSALSPNSVIWIFVWKSLNCRAKFFTFGCSRKSFQLSLLTLHKNPRLIVVIVLTIVWQIDSCEGTFQNNVVFAVFLNAPYERISHHANHWIRCSDNNWLSNLVRSFFWISQNFLDFAVLCAKFLDNQIINIFFKDLGELLTIDIKPEQLGSICWD